MAKTNPFKKAKFSCPTLHLDYENTKSPPLQTLISLSQYFHFEESNLSSLSQYFELKMAEANSLI